MLEPNLFYPAWAAGPRGISQFKTSGSSFFLATEQLTHQTIFIFTQLYSYIAENAIQCSYT